MHSMRIMHKAMPAKGDRSTLYYLKYSPVSLRQKRRSRWSSGMPILSANRLIFSSRSEEHTSELQSLTNLVCRLLLEKKHTKISYPFSKSDINSWQCARCAACST